MQVRPATAADIPAMIALERAAPSAAHWTEADYQQIFAGGRTALILDGVSVAGFIVARNLGAEWEIEDVVVSDRFRRQGLGSRLVIEVLKLAETSNAQSVFLEVRASNAAGRALYKKMGFIESGRRNAYYQEPEEDAVVCKKFLSAGAPKSC